MPQYKKTLRTLLHPNELRATRAEGKLVNDAGKDLTEVVVQIRRLLDRFAAGEQLGLIDELEALLRNLKKAAELLEKANAQLQEQKKQVDDGLLAAEKQRRWFRQLFDFAPDAYLVTDSSGTILDINFLAAKQLNASPDFLKNRPLLVFVCETDRDKFLSLLSEMQAARTLKEWEMRMRPAGERPAFDAAVTVIAQRLNDEPLILRWTIRDISERKHAEKALKTQQERTQKYLDSAGALVLIVGCDERVELLNKYGCELLEYDQQDIIGKNWFDHFIPARIREELRAKFRGFMEANANSIRWGYESPIITRSGKERIIDWRNIALTDDFGRITGTLKSGQDVTERKYAEEQLRREKEFTDHLINSSSDGVMAFDLDFRCTAWNLAMESLSGVAKEQMLGVNIIEFFPFLQGKEQLQVFRDTISGKRLSFKECPYVLPTTGKQVYIDSEFSPLQDQHGRIIGGLVLIRDVTERKLSQESLRESEARYRELSENLEATVQSKIAELQQAQRLAAIGQVVSIVAHEIRNPLQNIHMGVDLLRRSFAGQEEAHSNKIEIIEEVDSGVHQLNVIVNDLLEYSKPMKIRRTTIRFDEFISRILASLPVKLRDIAVELKLEHGDRPLVGDIDRIRRLLLNLIENAAEAMPRGGRLTIQSRVKKIEQREWFQILVRDTGVGVDAKTIKRIHEPFFTTKAKGTGLGLSICAKIVEAHSGKLRFSSKLGEGTTVEVTLPLTPFES